MAVLPHNQSAGIYPILSLCLLYALLSVHLSIPLPVYLPLPLECNCSHVHQIIFWSLVFVWLIPVYFTVTLLLRKTICLSSCTFLSNIIFLTVSAPAFFYAHHLCLSSLPVDFLFTHIHRFPLCTV